MSGLAGLLNCCGMKLLGNWRARSSALRMAPVMPSAAGVSTSSAPRKRSSLRRSMLIESGVVRRGGAEPVAARRADEGQCDAGVAAGRLDDHRIVVDFPRRLGGVEHADADAVL